MAHEPFPAFLISDRKRASANVLEDGLQSFFDLTVMPPVFVTDEQLHDRTLVDHEAFHARHLRPALRGEIGCALAHVEVYRRVSELQLQWALVVEDDVVISAPLDFASRVMEVVTRMPSGEAVIVNLNASAARPFMIARRGPVRGLWRPAVSTYTTSTYLINYEAAALLLQRQIPVRSQADWPVTPREVFFLQESVPHAQQLQDQVSLVDPGALRSDFAVSTRLMMWSGLWYWHQRKHFRGIADYWRSVLKTRVFRHLY